MPTRTGFFTRGLDQTITAIRLMASPEGTTIEQLTRQLSLTRRSVFRVIRNIEHGLHIPVVVKRDVFGGHATYSLPASFIEKLSNITITNMPLSFEQALLFLVIMRDESLYDLGEKLKPFYNT
jgi:hypothetical protein